MPIPAPIPAPALATPRRGLLVTAPLALDGGARYLIDGATFTPEPCAAYDPIPWIVCGTPPTLDDEEPRPEPAVWLPFALRGVDVCSTLGGLDLAERARRARSNLTATASWQAEREFSDAVASSEGSATNPHLTDPAGWTTAATVTSGAEDPAIALALLEQGLADCLHGARAMIHATPAVVTLWSAASLLTVEGTNLVTANDNLVVSGSGYSGDSPAGAAADAGTAWAYGTAVVSQLRGQILPETDDAAAQEVDHRRNEVVTWVTQAAMLLVSPCCKIAAQVAILTP